jgi:hypothetical protein
MEIAAKDRKERKKAKWGVQGVRGFRGVQERMSGEGDLDSNVTDRSVCLSILRDKGVSSKNVLHEFCTP